MHTVDPAPPANISHAIAQSTMIGPTSFNKSTPPRLCRWSCYVTKHIIVGDKCTIWVHPNKQTAAGDGNKYNSREPAGTFTRRQRRPSSSFQLRPTSHHQTRPCLVGTDAVPIHFRHKVPSWCQPSRGAYPRRWAVESLRRPLSVSPIHSAPCPCLRCSSLFICASVFAASQPQ